MSELTTEHKDLLSSMLTNKNGQAILSAQIQELEEKRSILLETEFNSMLEWWVKNVNEVNIDNLDDMQLMLEFQSDILRMSQYFMSDSNTSDPNSTREISRILLKMINSWVKSYNENLTWKGYLSNNYGNKMNISVFFDFPEDLCERNSQSNIRDLSKALINFNNDYRKIYNIQDNEIVEIFIKNNHHLWLYDDGTAAIKSPRRLMYSGDIESMINLILKRFI